MLVVLIAGCSPSENYTIKGDSVYIDDNKVYLNVTPHTLTSDGVVEIDFMSKQYSGDIDFVFGFDRSYIIPTNAMIYKPHDVTKEVSYTCNYLFNYTTNPKYFWCYSNTNGTTQLVFEHSFLHGNIPTKTAYWNETYQEDWVNWKPQEKVNYDYLDMNTWYYSKNLSIVEDQLYKLKFNLKLYPNGHGKYVLALKPSSETIQQAIANGHLYALDPWWETTIINYSIDSFNRANNPVTWGIADSGNTWVDETGVNNCIISSNAGLIGGRANDCTISLTGLGNTYHNSITFEMKSNSGARDTEVSFYNGTILITTLSFRADLFVKYGTWVAPTIWSTYSNSYRNYSIAFDPENDTIRLGSDVNGTAWVASNNPYDNVDLIRVNGLNAGAGNADFAINFINGNATAGFGPGVPLGTVSAVTIDPAIANFTSILNCSQLVSGTPFSMNFSWFKNGARVDTYNTTRSDVPAGYNESGALNIEAKTIGDYWVCEVYAQVKDDPTTWFRTNSTDRHILNLLPVLNHTNISWINYHNYDIGVDYNCTDPEGPVIWTMSGNITSNITGNNINGSGFIFANPAISDYGNHSWGVSCSDSLYILNTTFTAEVLDNAPWYNHTNISWINYHNYNISVDYNCSDAEGDPIIWTMSGNITSNITGNNINDSGFIFANPSLVDAGNHSWNVSCSDGLFSNVTKFTAEVLNMGPTFLHSEVNWTNFHTLDISTDFNCSDAEGDAITYEISNTTIDINGGLIINPATGIVTGSPSYNDVGVHLYNVNCTDGLVRTTQVMKVNVTQNILYSQSSSKIIATEGDTITFYFNINTTNVSATPENVTLHLGNATYTTPSIIASVTGDQRYYNYTQIVAFGSGTGNPDPGRIHVWNWTTDIPVGVYNLTTSPSSVTIIAVNLNDCFVYDDLVLNWSLRDEETTLEILNSSLKVELDLKLTSWKNSSLIWIYNHTWINVSNSSVCISPGVLNVSNYRIDFTFGFDSFDHVQEFYYLDNGNLSNKTTFNSFTTKSIMLYDLLAVDSTTFLFSFFDENGIHMPDILVSPYRYYIGEGIFRNVERSKEDDNGQTHVHLVEEDVIYYFMMSQNGTVIYTTDSSPVRCLASPCELQIQKSTGFNPYDTDWDLIDDGSYSVTTNKATRQTTLAFDLDSNSEMNLSIYTYNNNPDDIDLVASQKLTSTAGSITLNIPLSSGNNTFIASVYKDGTFVRSYWVDLNQSGQEIFGGTFGVFLAFIIVLSISLMAVTEGVPVIIFLIVALLGSAALKFIDLDWASIISLISAGGILIWKLVGRKE
jgi:hypothetical protein